MNPSGTAPVPPPWLVGDIGATNLRFALAEPGDGGFRLSEERRFALADHAGLEAALRAYHGTIAQKQPRAGALAIAGPVLGDTVEMTNTGWQWSTASLGRKLGLERLVCLNDVEAQALALPHLAPRDLRAIGDGAAIADAPRVVVAPGSGLGISALVTVGGCVQTIAGEGGHASIAPESGPERELVAAIAGRHGGHASWERVLSGPGIAAIHGWIEQRNGVAASSASQEEIVRMARAGEGSAKAAVDMFLGLLGGYAGDLALIFGARGGVYFGGGIVPAIADTLASSPLRARFESKGRFNDYLGAIPTAIIMHPTPGLIGAAAHLASRQGTRA